MPQLDGDKNRQLTIGELSSRSGVASSALHFYERNGLISSARTDGNQRRYCRDTLRRVAFIRVSQRVGIPLKDIRSALESLPESARPRRRTGHGYRSAGATSSTRASANSSTCAAIWMDASDADA